MKTTNIPFVYCNKIFYISCNDNFIELRDKHNNLTIKKTICDLKASNEPIDILAYRIYSALIRECSCSVSAESNFK